MEIKINRSDLYYRFYVYLLTYVYCPSSMQTVSLVEKILDLAADLWNYSNDVNYSEIKIFSNMYQDAANFVSTLYSVEVKRIPAIVNWEFSEIIPFLMDYARSNCVKQYFGV